MKLKKRFTLSLKNNLRFIPDETYMRLYFKAKLHYEPDFERPITFNEKLQWYKLNYHNPVLTQLADKYGVRSFVEERIGSEYLVPLYGVYNSAKDIDLDKLPEKFVLKCTHDSQSTFVCTNKSKFDFAEAKKRLDVALHRNWYWQGREWAYKGIAPHVVAERLRLIISFIVLTVRRLSFRLMRIVLLIMKCSIFLPSGNSAEILTMRSPTMFRPRNR